VTALAQKLETEAKVVVQLTTSVKTLFAQQRDRRRDLGSLMKSSITYRKEVAGSIATTRIGCWTTHAETVAIFH